MQNEFLARHGLQHRWLHPTAGEDNDDESGVGISVTAPGAREAPISRVDFIANLPTELAIHILAYLDASALAKASLTSRRWREIVSNQHIWRESCLRELTGTYAMGGPVQPNMGLGLPRNLPTSDWRQIYRVKKELDQRWKQGKARPVYLNGHTDSIYCLQFDEYVDAPLW
jgi:F-box and WD-40 domain protein 1/11